MATGVFKHSSSMHVQSLLSVSQSCNHKGKQVCDKCWSFRQKGPNALCSMCLDQVRQKRPLSRKRSFIYYDLGPGKAKSCVCRL